MAHPNAPLYPYTLPLALRAAAQRYEQRVEFLVRREPEDVLPCELLVRLSGTPQTASHRFESWEALEQFVRQL